MSTYTMYADKTYSGEYWDDTRFRYQLTREELIAEWADCLRINLGCWKDEPKYEVIILQDGLHLMAGTEKHQLLHDEALLLAHKLKEEEEAKEKARVAKAEAEKAALRKEQRRKQYEALKKEFEG
jgi:hypothetical protein